MPNLLRHLFWRSETHLLMERAVVAGATSDFSVPGVEVETGERAALEPFASSVGFPAGWAGEMLDEGATGLLAVDVANRLPLAMGWVTSRQYRIDEIGATINPGEGGIYLFGDLVAPAARGRRLQRLLVAERLRRATDVRQACTVVHPANAASVQNYKNEGFCVSGWFTRNWWLGTSWPECVGTSFTLRRGVIRFKSRRL